MTKGMSDTVYRDEPIPRTAMEAAKFTPPRYREMRNLARNAELHYEPDAKLFYEQGRFMEDFEDDFDFQGVFVRYFPTYQSMNDTQLRGYFSWRTKVRRGSIEKTQLSFAFVYIYELLNGIGVSTPEEGFAALQNFRAAYGEIDPQIDRYMRLWMRDYVVYHDLDKSLLADFSDAHFDETVLTLLNYRSRDAGEVFAALRSLSSYNIRNSRFFKRYPDDVTSVAYGVFSRLSEYYEKNHKNTFCERFFGKIYVSPYAMFKAAVFYHRPDDRNFLYEINEVYKYRCQSGSWSCERFFCYKGKIQKIGSLLKTIDFFMRRQYGFKSTLKPDKTTKIYQSIIDREIETFLENKKKAARPRIEIDVSQLADIREAARKTQGKLTAWDAEAADAPEVADEGAGRENGTNLSEAEYRFMQCLLYGKPYDGLLRSQGLMLSVLVDAINEKLFETFGDTAIACDGEKPALIEDYIEELKGIIEE